MANSESDVRQRFCTANCGTHDSNLVKHGEVPAKSHVNDWSFETDSTVLRVQQAAQKIRTDFVEQLDDKLGQLLDGFMGEIDKLTDNDNYNTQTKTEYNPLQAKTFVARDSPLTQLLANKNIQTIYNIFVAILIVFIFNTMVYEYIETGSFQFDFGLIWFSFGKFPVVMWTWCMMMLWTMVIVFATFQYWARHRHQLGHVPDIVWLLVYVLGQVIFLLYPVHVVIVNQLPPSSSIIVVAEQIRLMMKTHSFVRENVPRALRWKPSTGGVTHSTTKGIKSKTSNESVDRPCPDFSQFLYFLFAPTLIYRDSYPRTPRVRWDFVRTNLAQVLGCLFYTYYVFERFCVPVFRNFGKEELTLQNITLCVFGCMLPGTLILVLAFFAILHCWLNAHAEMLRFADRQFYLDWWNSKSFSRYYRTWNIVVHDWLYSYVYRDCQILGIGRGLSMIIVFFISASFHEYVLIMAMQFFYPVLFFMFGGCGCKNKRLSMIIVFFISASFHEYVLIMAMQFFYPVLFFMFGGCGFFFIFLTDKGSSQSWNVFMWVSLFIGDGLLMCLYSQEWFARKNCATEVTTIWGYIIPLSWYCTEYNV